ncbi:lysylphosphatidylglycerol synthase transmembrane domain-containing protein [Magnetospirillum sulfuroxidans]|uniref:Flippase-like domain-containing protein n=1 Tax=Magnetospirillum sulfuroxidans TaxID=611300 RepID=A0ABS5IG34_9PROT|nr:lysylphosphatidylglycerol synthase transmembrane domain-containing protein [Magnetospirillum sulfuroxidans]MBR9973294.1 flippase-like domain-containing protein [Magnetospirillum sulfuroxidans]
MIKRILPWLLKGGISIGLIAWVLSKVDMSNAWDKATAMDGRMVVLALVLMQIQIGLGVVRWGLVLRALDAVFRWASTAAVYYIGVFFSIVLPGAVGGDAVRMWFSRRAGLSLAAAVNSVALERAMTVFALVLLVCLTQPLLIARIPDMPGTWVFPLLLAVCVIGILVLASLDKLPTSLHRWKLVRGVVQLAGDTRKLFFHPAWSLGTLMVALIAHINLSLAVYVLAVGLNLDVHVLDTLVLVPPVILIMTLPISIAGWGVRETAMVTAFGFVGIDGASAIVLSIIFGIVTMVTALPGGLVFLLAGGKTMEAEELADEKVADDLNPAMPLPPSPLP